VVRVLHEGCCGLDVHKKSVTACVLWAAGQTATDKGVRDVYERTVGVGRLAMRLRSALEGRVIAHHRFLLRELLDHLYFVGDHELE
jgi:hypothetical protein